MKILANEKERTVKQLYDLTRNPETQKMRDHAGEIIEVADWLIYQDVNNDGKETTILSIVTPEGEIFGTNSATFMREFAAIVDMCHQCGTEINAVKISEGTSKSGRTFITAVLV